MLASQGLRGNGQGKVAFYPNIGRPWDQLPSRSSDLGAQRPLRPIDGRFMKSPTGGLSARQPAQDSPQRPVYSPLDRQSNRRILMSRKHIAVLTAVALLGATAAIAQTAGSGAPAPTPSPYEHRDPVAWMKSMCIEHFARSAGRMAYLEARLQLTTDQQPQWDKWRLAVAAGAEKERSDCLADVPAAGAMPTALDRDSHRQKIMAVKVATLQAARPALEALYQSLTPEQRQIFDRPMFGEHQGHHHHKPESAPL
jgi:hypothetical protein